MLCCFFPYTVHAVFGDWQLPSLHPYRAVCARRGQWCQRLGLDAVRDNIYLTGASPITGSKAIALYFVTVPPQKTQSASSAAVGARANERLLEWAEGAVSIDLPRLVKVAALKLGMMGARSFGSLLNKGAARQPPPPTTSNTAPFPSGG